MSDSIEQLHECLLEILKEIDRICATYEIPYVLAYGSALGAVRHRGFIPWDDDLDLHMLWPDYLRFLDLAEKEMDERFFVQRDFSEHYAGCYTKIRRNGTTFIENWQPKDPRMHQGVFVDIMPCNSLASTALGQKWQWILSRIVVAQSLKHRGYSEQRMNWKKRLIFAVCDLVPQKWLLKIVRREWDTSSEGVHTFLSGARLGANVYKRRYFDNICRLPFENGEYPVFADYDSYLRGIYGDYMKLPSEANRQAAVHARIFDVHRPYTDFLSKE